MWGAGAACCCVRVCLVGVVLAGGCIVSLSLVRGVPAAVCGAVVSPAGRCLLCSWLAVLLALLFVSPAGRCLLYSWLVVVSSLLGVVLLCLSLLGVCLLLAGVCCIRGWCWLLSLLLKVGKRERRKKGKE